VAEAVGIEDVDGLVLEQGEADGVEVAVDADVVVVDGFAVEREGVGWGDDGKLLTRDQGEVEAEGAGEEGELGFEDAGLAGEFAEGEDGVLAEVGGGGVFELDLGAAVAGGYAEALLEGHVGSGLVPVAVFGLSADEADIALDVAEADDLGVGAVGVGGGGDGGWVVCACGRGGG
jgi:hypothetical protein